MASDPREFIGLGAHEGWRFTMEPALLTATGAPGYIRRQLSPSKASLDSLTGADHEWNKRHSPEFAARVEKHVLDREPEWVEEMWLTMWLRNRMIKEVTRGE